MLRFIEINHSLLHRLKDNQEGVLTSIHNHAHVHPHTPSDRKALPLKQYSNKFLRENQQPQQKQSQKGGPKNSRLNNLITKHKFYQKKLAGALGRNMHVCRTEPNENEYKCFMTSNNFFREREHLRTQTESIHQNKYTHPHTPFLIDENEEERQSSQIDLKQPKQPKWDEIPKGKTDAPIGKGQGKAQQKISASRALEMYAKIITKDRGQLIEKIKFTNQKKTVREHILQSKKNLQICQMSLLEKHKKLSCIEKEPRADKASHTMLKLRKKTKSVDHRTIKQQENFELRGWEN